MTGRRPQAGRFSRRLALGGGAGVAATAIFGVRSTSAAEQLVGQPWVATWAAAQLKPVPADLLATTGFQRQTLRHVIQVTSGGQRLRLRLANPFGRGPIRVGPVTVALRPADVTGASAEIDAESIVAVEFAGHSEAVLTTESRLWSDPIDFPLAAGGELVVSFYVAGPSGAVSFHRLQHSTGYLASGNQVGASAEPYGIEHAAAFLLDGIEVDKGSTQGLAVLGDSITEGFRTPLNENLRLTDRIAARFNSTGESVAVANLGISGNQLLHDHVRLGESGLHRFGRDIMALPGLDIVMLAMGINDLRPNEPFVTPAEILVTYRRLAHRASRRGLRVVVATITPFKGARKFRPELEQIRQIVNGTLRQGHLVDAVADFDLALRDPQDPARIRGDLHVGDWIHPNAAGTIALADSVPLELPARRRVALATKAGVAPGYQPGVGDGIDGCCLVRSRVETFF